MKRRRSNREFEHAAEFRFYEELNDFLPPEQRKKTVPYRFDGHPGIKDPIEALGVPHVEVDLIVVNGASVGFDYQLRDGDRVAVYPVFEALDVSPAVKLRDAPLRQTAFVVDVNLGRLARLLRLLGFDALFSNAYGDDEIVAIAEAHGLPVLAGTEMNAHGQKFVDEFDVPEMAPLREAFVNGALILYAHTVLERAGGMGYLSAWARQHFVSPRERNAYFAELGRNAAPAGAYGVRDLGPGMTPDEVARVLGRGGDR